MTDQGNEPTRADTQPVGGPHDPTVVGVPPVGPEAETGSAAEGPPPGSPPPPWGPPGRPDRRPWVIIALLVALLVVGILVVIALQDDDDDDAGPTTTGSTSTTVDDTTTSEDTTTTEATTSTTEATTSTTAGGSPPVTADPAQCREAGADAGNPDPAAQAVFIAWTRGDEACARELMDDAAFDELFSRDGAEATDDFQGCTEQDDPEPHVDCAFTYEGGSTHYLMRFSPTDGWQVFEVNQVAD